MTTFLIRVIGSTTALCRGNCAHLPAEKVVLTFAPGDVSGAKMLADSENASLEVFQLHTLSRGCHGHAIPDVDAGCAHSARLAARNGS